MSERLDKTLVQRGMLKTRSQASMLIKQGDVLVNGKKETKASLQITQEDELSLVTRDLYVGRGALKLMHAMREFKIDFQNKVIADCGASTGGFTQIALQAGAKKIYAIDVGHDQLDETLKQNPRVENLEGVNLKNDFSLSEKVDICVVDLSFISITLTFQTIHSLLKPGGVAIVLIKPQFEAGRKRLGKNGIVKKEDLSEIISEVETWFKENNFHIKNIIESPIEGKTGNLEYLALIT